MVGGALVLVWFFYSVRATNQVRRKAWAHHHHG
jgi:hypothetical protein